MTPLFRSDQAFATAGAPFGRLRVALHFSFPLSFGEVPLLDVLLFAPAGSSAS